MKFSYIHSTRAVRSLTVLIVSSRWPAATSYDEGEQKSSSIPNSPASRELAPTLSEQTLNPKDYVWDAAP